MQIAEVLHVCLGGVGTKKNGFESLNFTLFQCTVFSLTCILCGHCFKGQEPKKYLLSLCVCVCVYSTSVCATGLGHDASAQ